MPGRKTARRSARRALNGLGPFDRQGYGPYVSADDVSMPAVFDRREHLAAMHRRWETPVRIVADVVGTVIDAPILGLRRIVAGEGNEVYDVALDGAPSLIVKIAHGRTESHDREAWAITTCAARGVPAPRLHAHRHVEVWDEVRSVIVMEKLLGTPLRDAKLGEADLRRVLGEVGAWLHDLHSIPVRGVGYLDGSGVGIRRSMDEWLLALAAESHLFEAAGRSVGLEAAVIRSWLQEIVDSFRAVPPRVALLHNDLLANHVLVHEGSLSGIIDFGEVAAEPAASEFAKWDFVEGDRFPVEWIQSGYGDRSLFEGSNVRTYRALWAATGLWLMQYYHQTGFPAGVAGARDRLVQGQQHAP